VTLAEDADVAMLILGDVGNTCGEWRDRDSLDLPGGQLDLLKAVAGKAPKTVLVLVHGRPVTFGANNSALDKVDAVLSAWRPGEEAGSAIVALLSGKVTPSAKLPISWPRTVGHVHSGSTPWLQRVRGKWLANGKGVVDQTGRRYDGYVSSEFSSPTPLFGFGFGLSYARFEYSKFVVHTVALEASSLQGSQLTLGRRACGPSCLRRADGTLLYRVQVDITNTGSYPGVEIVQLYVQDPPGNGFVPFWRRLLGFTRAVQLDFKEDRSNSNFEGGFEEAYTFYQDTPIPPGSTVTADFFVEWQDLAQHDAGMVMRVIPGEYKLFVGGSAEDTPLSTKITVD